MKPKPLDLDIHFAVELERLLLDKYGWEVDCDAILIIFDEIKQRIKQACEFYLRYMDKPELLVKEHPDIIDATLFSNVRFNPFQKNRYNEWLFKLAFKDILEEVKGK